MAEDGSYILMETGADVMSMGPTLSQVMTVQEISEQLSGVANGLEMFWQRGYIHGDVKPCNIVSFVVNGKRVFKIIDIELKVMDGRHKRNLDNKQSLSDVKDFWYYQIARQPFTLQLSYFKSFIDPKLAQIFLGFRGDLIQSEFDKNPRSARLIAENIDFRLGKMDDLLGYFTTVCNVVENSQIKLSPEQIVELKALKSMILFDRNLTTDALSNLYFNFDSIVSRVKRFVGSLSQN